jgi:DNA-directed RNA polymerase subunit beta'
MLAMNNEKNQEQPINFDAIKIGLASPEKIREWSHGEVKRPETLMARLQSQRQSIIEL